MERKSELYYEEIGDDFDRFMSDYDVERRAALIGDLFDEAYGTAKPVGRTLEIGCGTGAITATYRHRVDALLVTDISARLAAQVGEAHHAESQAEDATDLSFEPETFEVVVSSECIEHCPDPVRAVDEMVRVLEPGGVLILTTPNRLWLPVVVAAQRLKLRPFQGNEVFLGYRQLAKAVEAAGADVIHQTGCHLLPWQVPGIKPLLRKIDRHGDRLGPVMINQAVFARKHAA